MSRQREEDYGFYTFTDVGGIVGEDGGGD